MAQGAERLMQLTRQPGTTDDGFVLRGALGEVPLLSVASGVMRRQFLSVNAKIVTKLEAAIQAVGEDDPAAMGASKRCCGRGISDPVPEEVGEHDVQTEIKRGHDRIGVKNPGWRTSFGRIKSRSQRSAVSICQSDRYSRIAEMEANVVEATENVGQFVSRWRISSIKQTCPWGTGGHLHGSQRCDPGLWCSVGFVGPTQSHPLCWTSPARKWSLMCQRRIP